jgi:hypothetical protein
MSMGTPEPYLAPTSAETDKSPANGQQTGSRFANISTPANTQRMSPEDRRKLEDLQSQAAEDDRQASMPTEENATHTVLLTDGRIVLARSGAGTLYSEAADDGTEKFTGIIGIYAR